MANAGFFVVGQTARHGPGWDKNSGQIAKAQSTHDQTGDDLIAYAQIHRRVEHVVRQANGRRHGDVVSTEQAQLHPRLTLSHAIAHGRGGAGYLGGAAHLTCRLFNDGRKTLVGLVRAEHIVIGGNDADMSRVHHFNGVFGCRLAGGKAVRQIATGQLLAIGDVIACLLHPGQIFGSGFGTARDDSIGNFLYGEAHGDLRLVSWQRRWPTGSALVLTHCAPAATQSDRLARLRLTRLTWHHRSDAKPTSGWLRSAVRLASSEREGR